jgi:hypothetical protein
VAIALSPNENSNHDAVDFTGLFNGPSMGLPYGITNSSEIFQDPHEIANVERIAGNALYLSGTAALHFGLSGGGYKFGQLIGINENASIIKGWDLGLDLMLGETALDGAAYEVTDPYDLNADLAGGSSDGSGDKGDDNPGPKRDGHGNVIGM